MSLHIRHFVRFSIFLCFFAALSGCGNLSSNVVAQGENEIELRKVYEKQHDLEKLVEKLARHRIDDGRNVGIAIGVLDEFGQKHVFGYGRTDKNSDNIPNGDTIFAIGSLTKSLTALLLENLYSDGIVAPSDTVGSILSHETNFSEAAKAITLVQLVNHSSGLPRQPNNFAMLANLINYSFTGNNIYSHINRETLYAFLSEFHPDQEDVGKYRYSNIGIGLLGHLLEIKTGKSLPLLLNERILRPLGLRDTTYVLDDERTSRMATGYVGSSPLFVKRNTPTPNWDVDDILKGAAGLYSTVNDMLVLAQFRIANARTPIARIPVDRRIFDFRRQKIQEISLGWQVDGFPDGEQIHSLHGMIAGYSAYMGVEYEKGLAVVVLYNNFDWDDEIGHNLLLTLARNTPTRAKPEAEYISTNRAGNIEYGISLAASEEKF